MKMDSINKHRVGRHVHQEKARRLLGLASNMILRSRMLAPGLMCMMMMLMLMLKPSHAWALTPANIHGVGPKNPEIQGLLGFTETSYENENGGTFDLERTVIGAQFDLSKKPSSGLSPYALVGYSLESKVKSNDGDGFFAGVGAYKVLSSGPKIQWLGFANLNYVYDKISYSSSSTTFKDFNIHIGPAMNYSIDRSLFIVGSLDFAAFTNADAETKGSNFSGKSSYEQDNLATLKLGVHMQKNQWLLRIDAALLNENSIYLGFGQRI